MSLFRRGNIWWSSLTTDGVRKQISTGTGSRRRAEIIEQKLKEEANLRRHSIAPIDPDMTFEALAAHFIAEARSTAYHRDRLQHLLNFFGNMKICRIGKAAVQEYRAYRHSQSQVSDATLNRDCAVLKHVMYWAVDRGYLLSNPLARMPMVRERRIKRPVLSVEEEGLLLKSSPEHLQRFILVGLYAGMRRGEISHQCWEDVDFSQGIINVSRSKTPEGEAREIPLTRSLFKLLWENRENEGLIFTYRGKAVKTLKTTWKTTLRRAGVRHLRFHDLRHTFATRLMEAGVMQEVRKALMGHSSGGGVHATYLHVELPQKRDAIRKLESWVAAQTQKRSPSAGHPHDPQIEDVNTPQKYTERKGG
jgi:integrase